MFKKYGSMKEMEDKCTGVPKIVPKIIKTSAGYFYEINKVKLPILLLLNVSTSRGSILHVAGRVMHIVHHIDINFLMH